MKPQWIDDAGFEPYKCIEQERGSIYSMFRIYVTMFLCGSNVSN